MRVNDHRKRKLRLQKLLYTEIPVAYIGISFPIVSSFVYMFLRFFFGILYLRFPHLCTTIKIKTVDNKTDLKDLEKS